MTTHETTITNCEKTQSSEDIPQSFEEKLVNTTVFKNKDGFSQVEITDILFRIPFGDKTRVYSGFEELIHIPAWDIDTDAVDMDTDFEKFSVNTFGDVFNRHFDNTFNHKFHIPVITGDGECVGKIRKSINDVQIIYQFRDIKTGEDISLSTNVNELIQYTANDRFGCSGDFDSIPGVGDTITLHTNSGSNTAKIYKASPMWVLLSKIGIFIPTIIALIVTPLATTPFPETVITGATGTFLLLVLTTKIHKLDRLSMSSTTVDNNEIVSSNKYDRVQTYTIKTIDGAEHIVNVDSHSLQTEIETDNGTIRDGVIEFLTEIGMEKIENKEFNVRETTKPEVYNNCEHKIRLYGNLYIVPPDV